MTQLQFKLFIHSSFIVFHSFIQKLFIKYFYRKQSVCVYLSYNRMRLFRIYKQPEKFILKFIDLVRLLILVCTLVKWLESIFIS